MAANETIYAACKITRPLMSTDLCEARRRALGLYRAFFRYIPFLLKFHDIPKNSLDVRNKMREKFYANAYVTDCRVVDLLVIKGYMELKEIKNQWVQKGFLMSHWNPSIEPKRTDFVGKFLDGCD